MKKRKWKKLNAKSIRIECKFCGGTGYTQNKGEQVICLNCDGTGEVFIDS